MTKKVQVTYTDEQWEMLQEVNKDYGFKDAALVRFLSILKSKEELGIGDSKSEKKKDVKFVQESLDI